MSELHTPWLFIVNLLPVAIVILSFLPMPITVLRQLNYGAGILTLVITISLALLLRDNNQGLTDPWDPGALFGFEPWLEVDALSKVLLPFGAFLWMLSIGVMPNRMLDNKAIRRIGLATTSTLGSFLTQAPLLLAFYWILSIAVLLWATKSPKHKRALHVGTIYLGISGASFLLGTFLFLVDPNQDSSLTSVGVGLIFLAVLIRKGIFPVHSWLPEVFEHGRLGHSIFFSATQIGALVTMRLLLPHATPGMLMTVSILSICTVLYSALAAVFQQDARKALGYLFMSQSSLVMVGLCSNSVEGVTGALCLWLSSGIAFAGLGRSLLVLEARRGRLSLNILNGGYESMPLLASMFLVMGLATVGFPGTLGFIGLELLIHSSLSNLPIIGFSIILANALLGIAVLRMYFSLFCGPSGFGAPATASVTLGLKLREMVLFASLAAVLIVGGIIPKPFLQSRSLAAKQMLEHSQNP